MALIEARPLIGPPVLAAMAAIRANDSGSNSPTLVLDATARPSSHTTPSASTSQIIAARARSCPTTSLAASTTAMPDAKVTLLPPVRSLNPMEWVSPMMGRTLAIIDAQDLGRHERHGGARSTDVGMAQGHDDRSIFVDVDHGARLAAEIHPETGRDAAPLVGP